MFAKLPNYGYIPLQKNANYSINVWLFPKGHPLKKKLLETQPLGFCDLNKINHHYLFKQKTTSASMRKII